MRRLTATCLNIYQKIWTRPVPSDNLRNFRTLPGNDKRGLRWHSSRTFTTKRCYTFLKRGGVTPLISLVVWKLCIPERVQVFNWLSYFNKLLTAEILNTKGITGPSALKVLICFGIAEDYVSMTQASARSLTQCSPWPLGASEERETNAYLNLSLTPCGLL